MYDLKFSYTQPTGASVTEKYSTIMNFTDAVENGAYPKRFLNYEKVEARFFENPLLDKQFATVQDLYIHCVNIMRGHK